MGTEGMREAKPGSIEALRFIGNVLMHFATV